MDSSQPPGGSDSSGPPNNGPVYGFTQKGFERVTRATKLVEKELVPAAEGRRGRSPVNMATGKVAIVKTTITARSGKTPGTGTVTFQFFNETTGLYFDGTDDIEVKSPYTSSIAIGTWVTLMRAPGGWTIFGADCP